MPVQIFKTCGTSYPDTGAPPAACPICEDECQCVPAGGRQWLTPGVLVRRLINAWRRGEPNLFQLHTKPDFASGLRPILLRTARGKAR